MKVPKLKAARRATEYNRCTDNQLRSVVRGWLFFGKTRRQMGREVLKKNPKDTKGFQSMSNLHYLGLKKDFHKLFKGMSPDEAAEALDSDDQDFGKIISLLHEDPTTSPLNLQDLIDKQEKEIKTSLEDTHAARLQRISNAEIRPAKNRVYTHYYRRNPDIIAEALLNADGVCEMCGEPAPFHRATDGTPFLEVHHKISLKDGGIDTLDNVVAVCPNCHRPCPSCRGGERL